MKKLLFTFGLFFASKIIAPQERAGNVTMDQQISDMENFYSKIKSKYVTVLAWIGGEGALILQVYENKHGKPPYNVYVRDSRLQAAESEDDLYRNYAMDPWLGFSRVRDHVNSKFIGDLSEIRPADIENLFQYLTSEEVELEVRCENEFLYVKKGAKTREDILDMMMNVLEPNRKFVDLLQKTLEKPFHQDLKFELNTQSESDTENFVLRITRDLREEDPRAQKTIVVKIDFSISNEIDTSQIDIDHVNPFALLLLTDINDIQMSHNMPGTGITRISSPGIETLRDLTENSLQDLILNAEPYFGRDKMREIPESQLDDLMRRYGSQS